MNIDLKEVFKDVNVNSETAVKAIKDYCDKEVEIAKIKHEVELVIQARRDRESTHSIISGYVAFFVIPSTFLTIIYFIINYLK